MKAPSEDRNMVTHTITPNERLKPVERNVLLS
jgi:hypothetical protein